MNSTIPAGPWNCERKTKMLESQIEPDGPFSESYVQAVENALGRKLPDDYRQFVKKYGGAFVGGSLGDFSILGFFDGDENDGILSVLESHDDLRDDGVLPIADDELGNLYVMNKQNSIYYINYYGGGPSVERVAESFQDFIDRIVVRDKEAPDPD
ncbi:SMI1/KNR4 family protein [Luteolibacter sp. Populi]|uniref:SMI1/KNR4 family protein n=1 Tax=Luteolibacter sp. Populi TaxID=3230487 RepID=UPI0034661AF4